MSLQLIIGLVVAAALAASHWYAYESGGDNRENAIIAKQKETEDVIRETAATVRQEIGAEVAGQISGIRVVNRTINNEVQREIREKPVYLNPDCAAPVTGVVQLNAARSGATGGAGPGADATVPTGAAAGRDAAVAPR